ncbi:amino acid ABC transporter substrate-binding protein [Streptococcus macedonicus]|uniref:amino acid ABC transporter substrate-binding protein n=1 Tax=Streptococcus macedonicus TaxID=59310 RepID=UPI000C124236|nr:amino acid ABC transporter substrate-binding protein [Streptococcus macedonicus]MCW8519297.1 amino acid ABC transporter substrate-binding protein [Streptococcus macedonicus]MCW8521080.1 amino acid ABC transporter substrate-binding protein [Streptococcus macedonicus]MCW8644901.1 amino acid ABC transporter substrate-binding protein [Streptococcus macedonicus]PHV60488.1 amino acid ABC transporter substrate-binding protein [Streptococcus macedonicus]
MTLMKKILGVTGVALASTTFLAACSSSSSSSSSSSGKEEVVFATVGTTAPFSYEKDGELTGYDIEVAKAVFKDSDKYEVTFKKTEWSSIFTGLDSGKYQMGGNNISYTEERSAKYLFSYPIASTPSVLVVPNNSDITSYDDIGGHSTQVVQGTTTAAQLEKYNEENADNPVDINYTNENITQILTNLNDGKYDFKIFDAPTVNSVIKNQSLDNLKTIDLESEEQPYIYFIFGQDQEDLQKFVNKRLKELQENGTLTELSEKYLGGDYTPSADDLKVPTSD